jgi:saccharopine dehydrogenase (NAD+, L-lysine-forming)
MLVLQGKWNGTGVKNVEEFNPDPFTEQLNQQGLPWEEIHNPILPHNYPEE